MYLKYPKSEIFAKIPKANIIPLFPFLSTNNYEIIKVSKQEISKIITKSIEKSPYKIKEAAISEISASFLFSIRLSPCHTMSTNGKNIKMNENELNDMV